MSLRKLDGWVAAGLISAEQAVKIRAHEAASDRPWLQWAAFGIGGLAILLGLAALVSSNWDDIPASAKLAGHLLINCAAALGVWRSWQRGSALWSELALFLFAGSLLTGIALVGQVFQLSSPLWKPLLFWWLLASPALLLFGQGRLTALAWSAMSVWLSVELIARFEPFLSAHPALIALPVAAPTLVAALAVAARRRSDRKRFWADIIAVALLVALAGGSLASALWYSNAGEQAGWRANFRQFAPWLALGAGAAIAWLWRLGGDAGWLARLLLAALVAFSLPSLIPAEDTPGQVLAALLFAGLWIVVAAIAARTGHRGLFKLAVTLVALRLIAIYFEVFGDLAATGIGLIVSGLLVIGIAVAAMKLAKRWQPQERTP